MALDNTHRIQIVRVNEDDSDTVNKFLEYGWTLIGFYVRDYGEPNVRNETAYFVLAWQSDEDPFPKPRE
jgi:hypothetical protein